MLEKMIALIADQLELDAAEITADSDLVQDLGADSLDIVQMLFRLEKEFGIRFEEEEIQEIKTIGDVVAFVEKNQ